MSWSDDVLSGLSAETMKALREFASKSGIAMESEDDSTENVLQSVLHHFKPPTERETIFDIVYETSEGIVPAKKVSFKVKGVKRELGQTLESTGLTIWRAAEHLCQYIIDNSDRFAGKSVCELGSGLGLVSILLDKLQVCKELVVTDGDEPTLDLLIENKVECECDFTTAYLYWGQHEDFASEYPAKFDILMAADVIYEAEQVEPLISTVRALIKEDGEFIMAFARRNVPMDRVLEAAEAAGFVWEILDDIHGYNAMEPVYRFALPAGKK